MSIMVLAMQAKYIEDQLQTGKGQNMCLARAAKHAHRSPGGTDVSCLNSH